MRNKNWFLSLVIPIILVLSACGGEGDEPTQELLSRLLDGPSRQTTLTFFSGGRNKEGAYCSIAPGLPVDVRTRYPDNPAATEVQLRQYAPEVTITSADGCVVVMSATRAETGLGPEAEVMPTPEKPTIWADSSN